jgi:hypothetical protein
VDVGELKAGHRLLVHDDNRLEGDGSQQCLRLNVSIAGRSVILRLQPQGEVE